ncbi:hypothetical protein V8E55_010080 [Tylopilus felleus]
MEADEPAQDNFKQQVDMMLTLLGSRLEARVSLELPNGFPFAYSFQSLTYSNMPDNNDLTRLNITSSGFIVLQPNYEERVLATTSRGENELWSSQNLYRHLQLLESLVPRKTKASAHVWIHAFFFPASAMLPPDKRSQHGTRCSSYNSQPVEFVNPFWICRLHRRSSKSTCCSYICLDLSPPPNSLFLLAVFLSYPDLNGLRHMPSSFFVVETMLFHASDHVPQAVREMYACGKILQKKVLRGALTNGYDWVFLLIKFNNDYNSTSYQESAMLSLRTTGRFYRKPKIEKPWPDLIAAILSY